MAAAAAAARPLVTVWDQDGKTSAAQVPLPAVMTAPIRLDVVHFVHTNTAKNSRQPYAVSRHAGHQHSALSWGTGRAVARIPRVSGSGTGRAGQGAFGNMCRKGRMFGPTKIWRRWHRHVTLGQRRFATASAIAASALAPLVMARGHAVGRVREVPLVVGTAANGISKTKDAVALLNNVGAGADVEKAKNSRKIRAGKGKARNRRYVMRRGPLFVYKGNSSLVRALRNVPGVEIAHVSRLSVKELAPGAHVGRFIVWAQDAFQSLDTQFGTYTTKSAVKKGFSLPHSQVTNGDLSRVINSTEVQSHLRPAILKIHTMPKKANPLRHRKVLLDLNPHAAQKIARRQKKMAIATQKRAEKRAARRASFLAAMK